MGNSYTSLPSLHSKRRIVWVTDFEGSVECRIANETKSENKYFYFLSLSLLSICLSLDRVIERGWVVAVIEVFE